MSKRQIIELIQELGLKPSRRLGQNFLIDDNLREAIGRTAALVPGEMILEIGAGTGLLTEVLLAGGAQVTAIEFDHRLAAYLRLRFADQPRLTVIERDAVELDYDVLFAGRAYRCVANLPYAASSQIIARFLDAVSPPDQLLLVLQKEMADRLSAAAATNDYGALSVRTQARFRVVLERLLPATVFWPQPQVMSALVTLRLRQDGPTLQEHQALGRLVRLAFAQRRKKLVNLLRQRLEREVVLQVFDALGLAPDTRAEALTTAQFIALTQMLLANGSGWPAAESQGLNP